MAVETATYIGQLNAAFPAGGEPIAQGDDHLRLIKSTLQNSFPGLNSVWSASVLPFSAGGYAATNTQAAIVELDSKKISKDGCHIAGFASDNITSPYMRHTTSNAVVGLATYDFANTKVSKSGDTMAGVLQFNGGIPIRMASSQNTRSGLLCWYNDYLGGLAFDWSAQGTLSKVILSTRPDQDDLSILGDGSGKVRVNNEFIVGGAFNSGTANWGTQIIPGGISLFTATPSIRYSRGDPSAFTQFMDGSNNMLIVGQNSNGVVLPINGNAWSPNNSDARKKRDFAPMYGLAEVMQIEPVKFRYLEDTDEQSVRLGFTAQNLKPIIPEVVYDKPELAEDGTPFMTVCPQDLIPVLVQAVKELSTKLDIALAEIAALKAAQ